MAEHLELRLARLALLRAGAPRPLASSVLERLGIDPAALGAGSAGAIAPAAPEPAPDPEPAPQPAPDPDAEAAAWRARIYHQATAVRALAHGDIHHAAADITTALGADPALWARAVARATHPPPMTLPTLLDRLRADHAAAAPAPAWIPPTEGVRAVGKAIAHLLALTPPDLVDAVLDRLGPDARRDLAARTTDTATTLALIRVGIPAGDPDLRAVLLERGVETARRGLPRRAVPFSRPAWEPIEAALHALDDEEVNRGLLRRGADCGLDIIEGRAQAPGATAPLPPLPEIAAWLDGGEPYPYPPMPSWVLRSQDPRILTRLLLDARPAIRRRRLHELQPLELAARLAEAAGTAALDTVLASPHCRLEPDYRAALGEAARTGSVEPLRAAGRVLRAAESDLYRRFAAPDADPFTWTLDWSAVADQGADLDQPLLDRIGLHQCPDAELARLLDNSGSPACLGEALRRPALRREALRRHPLPSGFLPFRELRLASPYRFTVDADTLAAIAADLVEAAHPALAVAHDLAEAERELANGAGSRLGDPLRALHARITAAASDAFLAEPTESWTITWRTLPTFPGTLHALLATSAAITHPGSSPRT